MSVIDPAADRRRGHRAVRLSGDPPTTTGEQREGPKGHNLAFGQFERAGVFVTTVTRHALFADYLTEQLDLIAAATTSARSHVRTTQEIPFPYVLDGSDGRDLGGISPQELARHFPTTELADDRRRAGRRLDMTIPTHPRCRCSTALRTDFSLARLAHYTGTAPEHFQRFILFTNYHRYVDEFVDWAGDAAWARAATPRSRVPAGCC